MSLEDIIESLGGEIIETGMHVKTVAQAAKAVKTDPGQIVKSILFIADKGPVLVVLDGEGRVDLKKLEKIVGKVRLASPEEVKEITGYNIGEVPPVGVKVKTLVDRCVLEKPEVFGGGGSIERLCRIDPRKIVEFQKADVVDVRY